MPTVASDPNPEFRPYRRFLSWTILVLVFLGSSWVLLSVGVTIYRRGRVAPSGELVSEAVTGDELRACFDELSDVTVSLAKHLENFHHLLGRYDHTEAQTWAEEGSKWRKSWANVGRRCRLAGVARMDTRRIRKEMEQMATVHAELGDIESVYSTALMRFGRQQTPRLDRVRQRLDVIGKRIDDRK